MPKITPEERDRLALIEIVESAALIQQFLVGYDLQSFLADRRTCDAVSMHVFVISEAAGRLTETTRDGLGKFEWDQIRGVRNRLAHGYASLNFDIVWVIATKDVPALTAACRDALGPDPDLPSPLN